MSFLLPLALWGLLTLPIILVLHLLRQRREQLAISSLHLWRGLQQKRHGALPRHILLSLMLLLQLCVATALTLALARPALSFLLDRPRQLIFILDMTTSMAAEDVAQTAPGLPGGRRFDLARQMIKTQLEPLAEADTFAVISLDPHPQILLTGDGRQKAQALAALDSLTPGTTGLDLPAALTLANGLIDAADRQHQITILTDGAYTVEPNDLPPLLAPLTWQMISSQPGPGSSLSNQALFNVSARTLPDGRHRLFARVVNYAAAPVARTLRVSIDQALFDEIAIRLEAQGEIAQVWTLPAPAQTATVEIVEPDDLPLDNQAGVWLADTSHHRVLLISDTPDTLAQALTAQPGVELTTDTPAMARSDPADFDLVVFEGLPSELTAWPRGNLLIVNPPLGHPLLPAQNFGRNLRPDPESTSALLNGVDLSGVYFRRAPHLVLPDWAEADLLALPAGPDQPANAGLPLIFHGTVNNSHLVVWAFDLAESNLPARLALPLLTANTLSTLLSQAPPPVISIGEPVLLGDDFSVEIPDGHRLFSNSASSATAGGIEGTLFTRTRQPGLYKIYNENDELVAGFSVQAGSALESNLTRQLQPESLNLINWPQQVEASPEVKHQEFWPWLAGLALVVVITEGWLAWRR